MTALVEEYVGERGAAQLLRSLKLTQLIGDSKVISEEIAKHVEILSWEKGQTLIHQDSDDEGIHLLLQGRVQIVFDGREVAVVNCGGHIGELSLIDPRAFCCASAIALRETVTAKIGQGNFIEIANRHPILWRRASQIIGDRLREMNAHVHPPNPRPRVFLGCTHPHLGYEMESRLHSEHFLLKPFLAKPDEGTFPTQSLAKELSGSDIGILARIPRELSAPDGRPAPSRDALLYFCGICAGRIGPARTILVEPADHDAGTLTARFGFPSISYTPHPDEARAADLDEVAVKLREMIEKLGVKQSANRP
jgi:hypothetical protein